MAFLLGMDTGGTYTDSAVIDTSRQGDEQVLCKAKALTTKEDLTAGIRNSLENLAFDRFSEISAVSLSTTLATNAIVEGRGAAVGLIYLGGDLEGQVPASQVIRVKGRFDIMGRLLEDLDEEEARSAIGGLAGKVEAVAVSGYASVRNPKHEKQLAVWIREMLGLPVVCAHQLTTALGFQHRTVTAVLNARLIPVIDRLLRSTAAVLAEKNVTAPMMVVRGDGTLMTEVMAREKPIETILSGPAASVIGGCFLTGAKNALVLDMGGTTTDIADVTDGAVKTRREGAKVGGWRTRVQAAEISTFGLGGDSRIYLDNRGRLKIGPQKVIPLCLAGAQHPALINELKSFRRLGEFKSYSEHEADCFLYIKGEAADLEREGLSAEECRRYERMLRALKEAPHSVTFLAGTVGEDPEQVNMGPLLERGMVARISFTPTDVLHAQGRYNRWNADLSRTGAEILARRMEVPIYRFLSMVETMITAELAVCGIQSIADFEGEDFSFRGSPEAEYLLRKSFHKEGGLLQPLLRVTKPVVAIGAPAEAWVLPVGALLGTEVIVPEHADVANAVGAAVGRITVMTEPLISLDGNKYILNTGWSRTVYDSKEEAVFYAIHEGRKHVEHALRDAGCGRWEIVQQQEDILVEIAEDQPKLYAGTKFKITGVGAAG